MKIIESEMRICAECVGHQLHQRNGTVSSGFAVAMHILLTICTLGFWLFIIVGWKIGRHLTKRLGNPWVCQKCAEEK